MFSLVYSKQAGEHLYAILREIKSMNPHRKIFSWILHGDPSAAGSHADVKKKDPIFTQTLFLQSGGNLSEVWVTADRRPAVQMVLKQQEAAGSTRDFLILPQESSKSSELLFSNSNCALNVFTY